MKLKNIAIGDFVQVKKSMRHIEFKAGEICEVIDVYPTDKYGFDVLIQGNTCLGMVNHKDLKKPEPQLKQLDQSVFNNMHERWKFAAIDADGSAHRYNKEVFPYGEGFCYEGDDYSEFEFSLIGTSYDASNWQNSLIERDTAKELTGSELCKAMLARGDKYISGFGHHKSDDGAVYSMFADTITRHDHCFHSAQNAWDYFVPINNQGEPLTASDVGL